MSEKLEGGLTERSKTTLKYMILNKFTASTNWSSIQCQDLRWDRSISTDKAVVIKVSDSSQLFPSFKTNCENISICGSPN